MHTSTAKHSLSGDSGLLSLQKAQTKDFAASANASTALQTQLGVIFVSYHVSLNMLCFVLVEGLFASLRPPFGLVYFFGGLGMLKA